MQHRYVTWATWGAGFAFFAAADAALGTGAVQALADLCRTNTDEAMLTEMAAPGMPMEHSGHTMPWLISGLSLGSFAGFGHWSIAQRRSRAAWAPKRRPVLAGLALVATASGRISAQDMAEAWNAELDPKITEDDAAIAMARFANASPDTRRKIMKPLRDKSDRAALICMSVGLLKTQGDPSGSGLAMLEKLATDLGMSGLEIFSHWDKAGGPNQVAVAVGEARALGTIATRAIVAKGMRATSILNAPISRGTSTVLPVLGRAGHTALWAFIRALSSPRPARSDDQLSGLRRRFRRRSLGSRLPSFAISERMTYRRGLS